MNNTVVFFFKNFISFESHCSNSKFQIQHDVNVGNISANVVVLCVPIPLTIHQFV